MAAFFFFFFLCYLGGKKTIGVSNLDVKQGEGGRPPLCFCLFLECLCTLAGTYGSKTTVQRKSYDDVE